MSRPRADSTGPPQFHGQCAAEVSSSEEELAEVSRSRAVFAGGAPRSHRQFAEAPGSEFAEVSRLAGESAERSIISLEGESAEVSRLECEFAEVSRLEGGELADSIMITLEGESAEVSRLKGEFAEVSRLPQGESACMPWKAEEDLDVAR